VSIPDFHGRTADQIVSEPFIADSAWHVHAALSWIDYVKRTSGAIAMLPIDEYKKAIKNATKLYKLIDSLAPDYQKFAEFDQIIASIDRHVHPLTVVWDIERLKRIHGECSSRLLHFQGISEEDYLSEKWMIQHLVFLEESALWMWDTMRARGNLVVYHPQGLTPQTQLIWDSFR